MSQIVLNGIHLSFDGAETLPLSVVRRDSPAYDAQRNFFTVSLRNEFGTPKTLPFDEISRHIVLVYRDTSTKAEIIDNRTPPPKLNGAVEMLAHGETKTFQVIFEYPEKIAAWCNNTTLLQFCVKWEDNWLSASAYASGAYDWNHSFELCRNLRILDENKHN